MVVANPAMDRMGFIYLWCDTMISKWHIDRMNDSLFRGTA